MKKIFLALSVFTVLSTMGCIQAVQGRLNPFDPSAATLPEVKNFRMNYHQQGFNPRADIQWDIDASLTGYDVYVSKSAEGPWVKCTLAPITQTPFNFESYQSVPELQSGGNKHIMIVGLKDKVPAAKVKRSITFYNVYYTGFDGSIPGEFNFSDGGTGAMMTPDTIDGAQVASIGGWIGAAGGNSSMWINGLSATSYQPGQKMILGCRVKSKYISGTYQFIMMDYATDFWKGYIYQNDFSVTPYYAAPSPYTPIAAGMDTWREMQYEYNFGSPQASLFVNGNMNQFSSDSMYIYNEIEGVKLSFYHMMSMESFYYVDFIGVAKE